LLVFLIALEALFIFGPPFLSGDFVGEVLNLLVFSSSFLSTRSGSLDGGLILEFLAFFMALSLIFLFFRPSRNGLLCSPSGLGFPSQAFVCLCGAPG